MDTPIKEPNPTLPEPISKTISKKYESLCSQLGNQIMIRDRASQIIEELQVEINALDKLSPVILAAERSGTERAMSDYKCGSQGRKEPKTYEHAQPEKPDTYQATSEVDWDDSTVKKMEELKK